MNNIDVLKRVLGQLRVGEHPDDVDLKKLESAVASFENYGDVEKAFGLVAPIGRPRILVKDLNQVLRVLKLTLQGEELSDAFLEVAGEIKKIQRLEKKYYRHRRYAIWHVATGHGDVTAANRRELRFAYDEYLENLALEDFASEDRPPARDDFSRSHVRSTKRNKLG